MNQSLTSDRKAMDHCRPIALAQYKLLTIALVAAGYASDRYAVLNPACDYSRPELEERKEEWVELYLSALGLGVDLDTFPNVNDCILTSADLIETTPTKASLSTALAGDNNDLVFTARQAGAFGNLLQVQYVDPAGNNQALAVTQVGALIRVSLATGVAGAITSTASQVKAKIEDSATANSLVSVALKANNTGATAVTAMAATNLSGGTN